MNEQQITVATNSIVELMDATKSQLDDILELLAGNIISEEDCGRIKERIVAVQPLLKNGIQDKNLNFTKKNGRNNI